MTRESLPADDPGLSIEAVDHIGIRVSERERALKFYEQLGFRLTDDFGFGHGHPMVLRHASGVVLNLLGPAEVHPEGNVLMDHGPKYPGYTHMALRVRSLEATKQKFAALGIELSGHFEFQNIRACFIRDPDGNVIEFDEIVDASS